MTGSVPSECLKRRKRPATRFTLIDVVPGLPGRAGGGRRRSLKEFPTVEFIMNDEVRRLNDVIVIFIVLVVFFFSGVTLGEKNKTVRHVLVFLRIVEIIRGTRRRRRAAIVVVTGRRNHERDRRLRPLALSSFSFSNDVG